MQEEGENLTLEKLFNQPVQKPFTYNLNLEELKENHGFEGIFEQLKKIFVNGVLHTTSHDCVETDAGKSIMIDKITKLEIEKIKEYMLSIGVELIYKEFNKEDKDYYIRGLLYDIEKIKNIKISITSDWKTQLINTVSINVEKEQGVELMTKIKKHSEANYFLNLYKPETNKDFKIQYIKKDNPTVMHIIYFQAAKITDYHYYHRYHDNLDKHVR